MTKITRPYDWGNILFLTLTPFAAVLLGAYDITRFGVTWGELTLFVVMFFATGLSITGGYHRHFAHVSYQAHPAIRLFYLIFGACAMQNSALHWAADHRLHHRYTDTDLDPYNAGRGFWWSHMAWIFYQSPKDRDFSLVADLAKDKWVMWQHKHTVAIGLIAGFGLPALIGLAVGNVFGMVLWGGLIRVVFVHHATFFINSLAHIYGRQPFSRSDSSRDSWWLAFLTNGEGYHNFHHRFPSDYRNGIYWYQWDPTKWLIYGCYRLGLTDRLHRIPDQLILRARMEVEALDAEKQLQALPHPIGVTVRERIEMAREKLEHALSQWGETHAKYRELKAAKVHEQTAQLKRQLRAKLQEYESGLIEARRHWRSALEGLNRAPISNA
jgi:stearoyl-CoA desaturase (Delta-9 desaturase)